MISKLQKKYALSEKGAKDLAKAAFACFLQNICFMIPVSLLIFALQDLLNGIPLIEHSAIFTIGIIMAIVLIFLSSKFQYEATYYTTYIESGVRRITLAERLRLLPLSFFGKKDLADLTDLIMADCASLETAFSHFIPELMGSMTSTLLIAISLLFFDWRMGLAVLWVLPISFAIVASSNRVQKKLSKKAMITKIACADGIQECIEISQDLKANNAEEIYLKGLDKKIHAMEKRSVINEFAIAAFVVSAQLILKLGIVSVTIVGSYLLISGGISMETFFIFLLIVSRIYDPLQISLEHLAAIMSTQVNVDRMDEILTYPVQTGEKKLSNEDFSITFDHVTFAYEQSENVLNDVSFTAKQGEVTAFVGPSGGGKTTVSRLAARFWDIPSGTITVGGMDISKIDPETLLSLYSIVFQDVVLFDDSILENIRIGRKNATDEEVLEAAALANCDIFANALPKGYHSFIGENGRELSGGERQRISIARAFLKNAPIILMDEATASLDVENERLIQTALSRLTKDKTVIVIAHRMRTVMDADKIVVLSKGKVAETGAPKLLLEKETGIFTHMVNLQYSAEQWTI